jgi:hypothetical protein
MGRFFSLLDYWFRGPSVDTIARKPAHDKATCRSETMVVLNSVVWIAIVL